jgi:hypothetical protein
MSLRGEGVMKKLNHTIERFVIFGLAAATFFVVFPPQISARSLPGSLGRRSETLLGRPVRSATSSTMLSADGERVQLVGRGGLVQFSRKSGALDEVIFSDRLGTDGVARSSVVADRASIVSLGVARRRGMSFAARHYRGFDELDLREERLVNHRTLLEYRFVWQRREDGAWLPEAVKVGVNAHGGRVAYYWSERSAVKVSLKPKVSVRQARSAADRAVTRSARRRIGRPVLAAVPVKEGSQRLVWETRVSLAPARAIATPHVFVVRTDAQTGKTSLVATTSGQPGSPDPSSEQPSKLPEARASAALPVYGSCYDAKYWDALSSRYEANYCAAALNRAGYTPRPYDNTSALTAFLNYPTDAVFYFTGHSLEKYQTPGNPSSLHQAIGLIFEEGGPTATSTFSRRTFKKNRKLALTRSATKKGSVGPKTEQKHTFGTPSPRTIR